MPPAGTAAGRSHHASTRIEACLRSTKPSPHATTDDSIVRRALFGTWSDGPSGYARDNILSIRVIFQGTYQFDGLKRSRRTMAAHQPASAAAKVSATGGVPREPTRRV